MKVLMTIPGPGRKKKHHPLRRLVGGVLLAVVLYAAFFALVALRRSYPLVASGTQPQTSARGAFHVHSTRSDGRGTPQEIARAAQQAGLQFVVLTDHNQQTLAPPSYVDGVLLIDQVELSTPAGHVVALGLSRGLTPEERSGDVLGKIAELGGYSILSHPEQQKRPWTDWEGAAKATGLELYSADSMFRTAQRSPFTLFTPAAAAYLTNPVHGLLTIAQDQPGLRDRLLQLAAPRPYVALCAHDAHGLPAYQTEFETLALYLPPPPAGAPLLDPDPEVAARQVIDALVTGRAWCGFRAIGEGSGFAVDGLSPEGRTAHAGDVLKVELPTDAPAEVAVRVSGPATLQPDGRTLRVDGAGAVQVEVWAKVPGMYFQDGWKPWLVASPFRALPAQPAPAAAPVAADAPAASPGGEDAGTPAAAQRDGP